MPPAASGLVANLVTGEGDSYDLRTTVIRNPNGLGGAAAPLTGIPSQYIATLVAQPSNSAVIGFTGPAGVWRLA